MPFTKFNNLDFDQIKTSIKDYLRANSNFTDFDFEGSNFSVLIDTLAYNTYITAFNSNMVANESFLDSATLRENVVSIARTIGYIPASKASAKAEVIITINSVADTPTLTLNAGTVCLANYDSTAYNFSIPENITTNLKNGTAIFGSITNPVILYEGTFLKNQFTVDTSINQRFIVDNDSVDASTIKVYVKGPADSGLGIEYTRTDNILNLDKNSRIYLIQEVKDEKYEIIFGDGLFGKKLENNSVVTITYITTSGLDGNGPSSFSFSGSLTKASGQNVIFDDVNVSTISKASSGGNIESIDSIKYYAPRLYSSQYRAVTARDYESIIKSIYPNAQAVSVVGGEELSPPQYGKVFVSIKPKSGFYVSDFDKRSILFNLKNYSLSGVSQEIIDLKVLYIELDSSVYYNSTQVTTADNLKTNILNALDSYSSSLNLNKFGGRFKYSKVLQIIDNVDNAITSNITKIIIRRDLRAQINQFAQYELCYGNKFHINEKGFNIKSTGFKISGVADTVYLTDVPNKDSSGNLDGSGKGVISVIKISEGMTKYPVVIKSAGTVDYTNGEIILNTINITSTERPNNIIEVQAFPESNDIVGLRDLYLAFSIDTIKINMLRDVISSGDDISGSVFVRDYYTSSYSNGEPVRK